MTATMTLFEALGRYTNHRLPDRSAQVFRVYTPAGKLMYVGQSVNPPDAIRAARRDANSVLGRKYHEIKELSPKGQNPALRWGVLMDSLEDFNAEFGQSFSDAVSAVKWAKDNLPRRLDAPEGEKGPELDGVPRKKVRA